MDSPDADGVTARGPRNMVARGREAHAVQDHFAAVLPSWWFSHSFQMLPRASEPSTTPEGVMGVAGVWSPVAALLQTAHTNHTNHNTLPTQSAMQMPATDSVHHVSNAYTQRRRRLL